MGSRYGLEIRAVAATDAPGLAELFTACGRPVGARDIAERIERLRHAGGVALIAVAWGPPSGLVVLHWHQGLDAAQPAAEISTLMVAPDDRRGGIGRLLLKAGAQAARAAGCGVLRLCAGPGQEDLRAFCTATGFAETETCHERPLRKRS